MARRSAGRPRTPVLTQDRIARAALDLADAHGDDAITMHRLARELGVAPSALYNHVSGIEEVKLLIQDEMMGRVTTVGLSQLVEAARRGARPGEGELSRALETWAWSYRETFARYPGLVPLIATLPVGGAPATQAMYETVAAGLRAAGLPKEQVMPVIVAFESFLFGSAMDVHAPADVFTRAPDDDAAATPTLQEALDAQPAGGVHGGNPYADPPFRWGLRALCEATERACTHIPGKEPTARS
ncbi:TetR/AcrR family transcriptional regulator C-terminal domain-containing protein [Corynebacterium uropygiale]|uniref:TetR/AcrR family transcriptional regulator C-terminal domain-containing protein n=1 Tax=Corynebacterium uropygiale TaxID=1775911 RepID=A0A9X1QT43_9CORY|nr:TetR/AcrR family transcriptional regulator C-terminal domain-containing protein [Corynebacterium uropygiale]MCF4007750.1 TetR/AcrR family transcriptional regulator C-terminal domain-containing protein [Corynebacterium uropygiale]